MTNSRKVLNQGLAYAGWSILGYVFFKVWVTVDLIGGDPKALDTLDLLSFFFMHLQGKSQMY